MTGAGAEAQVPGAELAAANEVLAERVRYLEQRVAGLEKAMHRLVGEGVAKATPAPVGEWQGAAAQPSAAPQQGPAAQSPPPPPPYGRHHAGAAASAAAGNAGQVEAADAKAGDAGATHAGGSGGATHASGRGGAARLWSWLTGGNTVARMGVIVLFLGVSFLVKYASQHLDVPIELRLAGVALGGLVLVALGLVLRNRRPAYAATLQGAGVGVLYLTVFAAVGLYHVLSPGVAFTLLVLLVATAGVLALREDALALAVLGALGGYLAPVLTGSDSGNQVILFSYYTALNAGVFAMAWVRTWRGLNVLGFACTFIVATLWGVLRYRPDAFSTTEPFLVAWFLFYVGVNVAYGLRRSLALRYPVDATLVFGTPIVVATLQSRLVQPYEYGMAWSAVAIAVLYGALARTLGGRRQPARAPLADAFTALAVVFATLAIPLAFDARLTSAMWAIEGAALCAYGLRVARVAPRLFGLALQLAAAVAYTWHIGLAGPVDTVSGGVALLNRDFIGAAVIGIAGTFTAWRYDRASGVVAPNRAIVAPLALAWALAWWVGAGWHDLRRFAPADMHAPLAAWLAVTACLLLAAAETLRWRMALAAALLLPPLALLIAVPDAVGAFASDAHLLHGWGLAWLAVAIVAVLVPLAVDHDTAFAPWPHANLAHAAALWLVTLLATVELAWGVMRVLPGSAWHAAALLTPAIAVTAAALRGPPPLPSAVRRWARAYCLLGGGVLLLLAVLAALVLDFTVDGDATPLPFVPLLNPLDLAFAALALVGWRWRGRVASSPGAALLPSGTVLVLAALGAWAWLTMTTLRTLHQWIGVAFAAGPAWHSPLVQMAWAIVWTLAALVVMVVGHRRDARVAWMAGAALLGVVVIKLFLLDLAQAGTVERIVSFIGVGGLLLAVGYLAPVPPRRQDGHRQGEAGIHPGAGDADAARAAR